VETTEVPVKTASRTTKAVFNESDAAEDDGSQMGFIIGPTVGIIVLIVAGNHQKLLLSIV
jgi:hypothetical protein